MCYTNVVNVSRTLVHSIQDVVLQELPEALDYDSEEEDEYVGRADILEEIVLPAEVCIRFSESRLQLMVSL